MGVLTRIEASCAGLVDERSLRIAVLGELGRTVPFEAYAWLLTDPQTCVGTAALASVPAGVDLPGLIRSKYLSSTNRWTVLPGNTCSTLLMAGGRSDSTWARMLAGYGVRDVASVVFADRYGCWAFLDLWRCGDAFGPQEVTLLAELARWFTPTVRERLAATLASQPVAPATAEPAVLLFDDDLHVAGQTAAVADFLRRLLPTAADHAPVPAAAYNVAAQLLASEAGVDTHPARARAHIGHGVWVTLSAARLNPGMGSGPPGIAVSIETTTPSDHSDLFARVVGLSERERQVLGHLISGAGTREIAGRMFISENTVQDHLTAMFSKAGVRGRRLLVARATGGHG